MFSGLFLCWEIKINSKYLLGKPAGDGEVTATVIHNIPILLGLSAEKRVGMTEGGAQSRECEYTEAEELLTARSPMSVHTS